MAAIFIAASVAARDAAEGGRRGDRQHRLRAHGLETLLARGYRSVAFLGGPEDATSTQDRLAGFQQAMGQAGVRRYRRTDQEADGNRGRGVSC